MYSYSFLSYLLFLNVSSCLAGLHILEGLGLLLQVSCPLPVAGQLVLQDVHHLATNLHKVILFYI